jgi:photosystem II stability/assembly factor-like uncharacterized protein
MKKKFWLYLLLFIILSFNLSNAQWVNVGNGMPLCFTNDGTYIYAGLFDAVYISGDTTTPHIIIRSSDNGITWTNINNGLLCNIVYSLAVKGSKLFAGSNYGIYVSSNHGDSWMQQNFDPSNGDVHALIAKDSIIFAGADAGDPIRANCEKGGIFLSTDDGNTWIPANSGLRDNCSDKRIYAFTKIGNTLFEGSWLGFLCLTTNNGEMWIPIANTRQVTSFAVVDSILFVGGWTSSVFRTTDKGLNWTLCESGLSDSMNGGYSVNAIVASGKNLFVGTDLHGVFLSNNLGNNWIPVNDNLGNNYSTKKDILSLAVIDEYLFAGTGDGIWRRPLSDMTTVNRDLSTIPNEFKLGQNYPNPFNPSTTIDYSIPRRSFVTITIFDLLGRKVTTMVNSEMAAGNHKVKFDGSSFSSGIYFYQLKVDDYFSNKKMILVK